MTAANSSAAPAQTTVAMAGRTLPLLPAAAFVLVWSSGYISGPAAVRAAAPLTVLGWRFVLAAALGALVALAGGAAVSAGPRSGPEGLSRRRCRGIAARVAERVGCLSKPSRL